MRWVVGVLSRVYCKTNSHCCSCVLLNFPQELKIETNIIRLKMLKLKAIDTNRLKMFRIETNSINIEMNRKTTNR